ncbi:uncharacterized protein KY384_004978 [Bacidia gigantensis]|uniref:uncharacterized protein n=1 Tax=Bacidia gigantensis TaxID=2732470 RepID=UPI001D03C3CF|nr:uncharacterized protein KY384_004978 [Bacidia gigantensis]KAG8530475.1 hypothetical protein KY384_004978 [Bacidia gigantensis]
MKTPLGYLHGEVQHHQTSTQNSDLEEHGSPPSPEPAITPLRPEGWITPGRSALDPDCYARVEFLRRFTKKDTSCWRRRVLGGSFRPPHQNSGTAGSYDASCLVEIDLQSNRNTILLPLRLKEEISTLNCTPLTELEIELAYCKLNLAVWRAVGLVNRQSLPRQQGFFHPPDLEAVNSRSCYPRIVVGCLWLIRFGMCDGHRLAGPKLDIILYSDERLTLARLTSLIWRYCTARLCKGDFWRELNFALPRCHLSWEEAFQWGTATTPQQAAYNIWASYRAIYEVCPDDVDYDEAMGEADEEDNPLTRQCQRLHVVGANTADEPDQIGVEGSMKYLQDLGVQLDEPVLLTVLAELGAPTMGELTRQGFVEGWTRMRADSMSKQQSQIPSLRRGLPSNVDLFRKTYKATFQLGRPAGAKVLPLETATEYWRLLLSPPSIVWSTTSTPWLDWWLEYLEAKWKKAVSKDMWDQTGLFVLKSMEDETMSWWSEEGSWPGVIDEFVAFVRTRREESGKMDTG